MAKKAVLYSRVSTDGQMDGYGLASQVAQMVEWASKNGVEIVKVFQEEGVSGKTDVEDRLALGELFNFIEEANAGKKEKEINMVIIPALDRLARKLTVQEGIINDIYKKGLELVSVREPDLDGDDPTRVLVRQVLGGIAEYERKMIVARMKAGRITKAKSGQHAQGRIPMGYKNEVVDGKKVLTVNEDEAEVVRDCFELRAKGWTYRAIAKYLNDNYKPKRWTPEKPTKFHDSTVRKILANTKYMGVMELRDGGKVVAHSENEALRIL